MTPVRAILWLVDDERQLPPGMLVSPAALGSTVLEDGSPGGLAIVLADRAVRLTQGTQKQSALTPFVFSRLLGRIAAHELGHVLLRSAAHDATGLMRASFGAADVWGSSLDTDAYRLSPNQRAVVQRRLAEVVESPDDRALDDNRSGGGGAGLRSRGPGCDSRMGAGRPDRRHPARRRSPRRVSRAP